MRENLFKEGLGMAKFAGNLEMNEYRIIGLNEEVIDSGTFTRDLDAIEWVTKSPKARRRWALEKKVGDSWVFVARHGTE